MIELHHRVEYSPQQIRFHAELTNLFKLIDITQ